MLPVLSDMVEAVEAQTNLLALVREIANSTAPNILGRPVLARENFWGAWAYRSILITFEVDQNDRRAGFHPYGWFLYYDRPTRLVFAHKATPQDEWNEMDVLDLAREHFFALDEDQKRNVLHEFLSNNLVAIIKESAQY